MPVFPIQTSPPGACTTRTTCRVCGSSDLTPLFSLGDQYVSDFVPVDRVRSGPRVPLDVDRCNTCTLVQARHTAPQDFLYTRHYWYRSGVTQTMRDALRDVAFEAAKRVELRAGDVVLDIGSNDGTLLRNYWSGLHRVGVEPARNMQQYYDYTDKSLTLIPDFWSAVTYFKTVPTNVLLQNGPDKQVGVVADNRHLAKIVTALGMFYDLEDPNQFIADIAKVLHPDGLFVAQRMCLKQTLEKGDVGNFAHEHLEFYTLESLELLFYRHGLRIESVEENAVNGGSYRLYIRHADWMRRQGFPTIQGWEADETLNISSFLQRIERTRKTVRAFVESVVSNGDRVWVYGASTKGNVLLQYWGLDSTLIEAAADRSPEKWGKYTVGTGIPIRSEGEFRWSCPDYALVLPYAFTDEFLRREVDWRNQNGKFIVPLPEFQVV